MKRIKKLVSLMLVLMLVLGLSVTAFADDAVEVTDQGQITIKDNGADKVAGRTFAAYKLLNVRVFQDGDELTYVYEVPEGLEDFYRTTLEIDENVENLATAVVAKINGTGFDLYAFAEAAIEYLKDTEPTKKVTAGADDTEAVIDGLELGYYVVADQTEDDGKITISALMLDTTNPEVEITIKADTPQLKKEIVEIGSDSDDDEVSKTTVSNSASVGDTVNFQITSKVPDMTGYERYNFIVTDTMGVGFDFQDDVEITIGDTPLTRDMDYTVDTEEKDGETILTIAFTNFIQWNNKTGQEIKITYSAEVNEDAFTGVSPNTNKVTLTYSRDPRDPEVTGETPEQTTYTYITGVQINKVGPSGEKLTGAEFEITGIKKNIVLVKGTEFVEDADGTYYKLTNGSYTQQEPTDATASQYEDTTTKYRLDLVNRLVEEGTEEVSGKAFVDENGILIFDGLAAGEYEIAETTVPDGYNGLTGPIKLVIELVPPTEDEADANCSWKYTATIDGELFSEGENVGMINLTIVNQGGQLLPSTGGIGTTMFYVIGAVLVLGAGVLLVVKKRMSSN